MTDLICFGILQFSLFAVGVWVGSGMGQKEKL
jgi:hypothetical protein